MRVHLPALALLALPSLASAIQVSPTVAPTGGARIRHSIQATLDPKAHRLAVEDAISLPAPSAPAELLLNAALQITKSEPALLEIPLGDTKRRAESRGGLVRTW